jgi:hypothetical protein
MYRIPTKNGVNPRFLTTKAIPVICKLSDTKFEFQIEFEENGAEA